MNSILKALHWKSLRSSASEMGIGSYAIIAILLGLLIWVIVIAAMGWSSAAGVEVPAVGYVAMAFGILISIAVGSGLMALVFYSSRAGYDEPAQLIKSDDDRAPE